MLLLVHHSVLFAVLPGFMLTHLPHTLFTADYNRHNSNLDIYCILRWKDKTRTSYGVYCFFCFFFFFLHISDELVINVWCIAHAQTSLYVRLIWFSFLNLQKAPSPSPLPALLYIRNIMNMNCLCLLALMFSSSKLQSPISRPC